MHQQPQADGAGPAQLPHADRHLPDGRLEESPVLRRRHRRAVGLWPLDRLELHALLLGYLEQTALYNAANFSWGPGASGTMGGSKFNSTVYNSVINSFLCPSDPNAGRFEITAIMRVGRPLTRAPSPPRGCSRLHSYGIRDCIDGTPTPSPSPSATGGHSRLGQHVAGRRLPGRPDRERQRPRHRRPGIGDPKGYYGQAAQFLTASSNPAAVLAGLQACARPRPTRPARPLDDAGIQLVRRQRRLDLHQHHPDAKPRLGLPRRGLPVQLRRLRHRQLVQLCRVEQPPGRGQCPDWRRPRRVRQGYVPA